MIVTYYLADGTSYLFSNRRRAMFIPEELLELFMELLLKRNLFVQRRWVS